MPRIFIFGSCVSRDILEIAEHKGLTLSDYFARSSFASLAGKPYSDPEALDRLESRFQRRMLSRDHDKSVFQIIHEAAFDILLVDFIDERFRITRDPGGAIATLSNEFLRVMSERNDSEVIDTNTDERRSLWRDGWGQFVDAVTASGQMHKLVVNKVYWDAAYSQPRPGAAYIDRMNNELDWYYGMVRETCPNAGWLTHSAEALASDPHHKWGPAPYHYSQEFYDDSMRDLVSR